MSETKSRLGSFKRDHRKKGKRSSSHSVYRRNLFLEEPDQCLSRYGRDVSCPTCTVQLLYRVLQDAVKTTFCLLSTFNLLIFFSLLNGKEIVSLICRKGSTGQARAEYKYSGSVQTEYSYVQYSMCLGSVDIAVLPECISSVPCMSS